MSIRKLLKRNVNRPGGIAALQNTYLDLIGQRVGWGRAAPIVGRLAELERAEAWVVRDAFVRLLLEEETRSNLLDYPLPPFEIAPYSENGPEYAIGAVKHADCVLRLIDRHHPTTSSLLDFGCGTGRVMRFVAQLRPEIRLSGCDVNARAIDWLAANGPTRNVKIMQDRPRLDWPDGQFDVVLAWSIFTHYSEPFADIWLDELARVTAPGGLMLLTIHSVDVFATLATLKTYTDDERAQVRSDFDDNGYGWAVCYTDKASAFGVDREQFGFSVISHDYVRARWSRVGEILELSPAVPGWQDMVVIRRTK